MGVFDKFFSRMNKDKFNKLYKQIKYQTYSLDERKLKFYIDFCDKMELKPNFDKIIKELINEILENIANKNFSYAITLHMCLYERLKDFKIIKYNINKISTFILNSIIKQCINSLRENNLEEAEKLCKIATQIYFNMEEERRRNNKPNESQKQLKDVLTNIKIKIIQGHINKCKMAKDYGEFDLKMRIALKKAKEFNVYNILKSEFEKNRYQYITTLKLQESHI